MSEREQVIGVVYGPGATPEAVSKLRRLASEIAAIVRSDPGPFLRAGVRLETLGVDDDLVLLMDVCRDLLGKRCPSQPFRAGAMMIDHMASFAAREEASADA